VRSSRARTGKQRPRKPLKDACDVAGGGAWRRRCQGGSEDSRTNGTVEVIFCTGPNCAEVVKRGFFGGGIGGGALNHVGKKEKIGNFRGCKPKRRQHSNPEPGEEPLQLGQKKKICTRSRGGGKRHPCMGGPHGHQGASSGDKNSFRGKLQKRHKWGTSE